MQKSIYHGRELDPGEVVLLRSNTSVRASHGQVILRTPGSREEANHHENIEILEAQPDGVRLIGVVGVGERGEVLNKYRYEREVRYGKETSDVILYLEPNEPGGELVRINSVNVHELEIAQAQNMALIIEAARSPQANDALRDAAEYVALYMYRSGNDELRNAVNTKLKNAKDYPQDVPVDTRRIAM